MKLKDKLRLMDEIERRNQARIKDFIRKSRKGRSSGSDEKTEDNRVPGKKPK